MEHIESIVYQVPITSIEYLKNEIKEAIQRINENALIKVWNNLENRSDLLVFQNGGHIEQIV